MILYDNILEKRDFSQYRYILINVCETAVVYPWNSRKAMYCLMEHEFIRKADCNAAFREIRNGLADFWHANKLEAVYRRLAEEFHIDSSLAETMKKMERKLLLDYAQPRKSIQKLYGLAETLRIPVYFYTDSGDSDTVKAIMKKCGYKNPRMICGDGNVMTETDGFLSAKKLFIGDKKPETLGEVDFFYIPETTEVLSGYFNPQILCENAVKTAAGNLIHYQKAKNSAGFGVMQKVVANSFFDNPFVRWKKDSYFNGDPYFAGYYALGMHLMGIVKWLSQNIKGKKRILFCARDGYLIQKVYDLWRKYVPDLPESLYLQASRKALMPILLKSESDFYVPPGIFFDLYTPKTIMLLFWEFTSMSELYDFRHISFAENEVVCRAEIEKAGFSYESNFQSRQEFERFITFFLKHYYSKERHCLLSDAVSAYYKEFDEGDVLFDAGYSGRLAKAVVEHSSGIEEVYYLYTDEEYAELSSDNGNFKIHCFYPFTPSVDNVLREYLIAENAPTCVGIARKDGKSVPVLQMEAQAYQNSPTIIEMQRGAFRFAEEMAVIFGGRIRAIPFKPQEVSLPFEGFIRNIAEADLVMFEDTYQEDYDTGQPMKISWAEYYHELKIPLFRME